MKPICHYHICHYHILSSPALEFPLCFRRIHYTGSSIIFVSSVLGSPKLLLTYLRTLLTLLACFACLLYLLACLLACSLACLLYRVLLEKLTVLQLVKKSPAFYGIRRFITAFTNARQLSLSWGTEVIPSYFPTDILILRSYKKAYPKGHYWQLEFRMVSRTVFCHQAQYYLISLSPSNEFNNHEPVFFLLLIRCVLFLFFVLNAAQSSDG
jgi:hypothetical protein